MEENLFEPGKPGKTVLQGFNEAIAKMKADGLITEDIDCYCAIIHSVKNPMQWQFLSQTANLGQLIQFAAQAGHRALEAYIQHTGASTYEAMTHLMGAVMDVHVANRGRRSI